jgi:GT2 family glycosyltransferase
MLVCKSLDRQGATTLTASRVSGAFAGVTPCIINYNTADLTHRCVQSVLLAGFDHVLVLDNQSRPDDRARLGQLLGPISACHLLDSPENMGFAEGMNQLVAAALEAESCTHPFLLNSDCVLLPEGVEKFLVAARRDGLDLAGARVHVLSRDAAGREVREDRVDSLGVVLYRNLLTGSRIDADHRFLGPTGGFALLSRHLVETVVAAHGHLFDPDFFCYAEDADLAIRAHLLGLRVGYCPELVAWHEAHASSDGAGYNDFMYYHNTRNMVWMAAKSLPFSVLLRRLPWVLLAHLGMVLLHGLTGRPRLTLRIYRDALRGLPAMLRKRRRIMRAPNPPGAAQRVHRVITPRFFQPGTLQGRFRPGGRGA